MFVLPNNKNIIMAAQQCVGLTDQKVVVIPTATVPQGISAMMAVDLDQDAATIESTMTEAAQNVATAQITYAARDSEFDGFDIHEGDYLALLDGKLFGTNTDIEQLLSALADEAAKRNSEFINVFYGADVTEQDAQAASRIFGERCPASDISTLRGGQPVYYYIISME